MLAQLFTTIGTVITSFVGILGNGLAGIISLFWDGTAFTNTGILMLIPAGVGLVWGAYSLIKALIRVRTR